MALRTAVAAAAAPRGFRRLFSTTFAPPFNPPSASVAAQQREKAEPSTNLFVSGKPLSLYSRHTLHFLSYFSVFSSGFSLIIPFFYYVDGYLTVLGFVALGYRFHEFYNNSHWRVPFLALCKFIFGCLVGISLTVAVIV